MPFVFKAPETTTRPENPADMLLRTWKAGRVVFILGVTLPKYNGVVVDSLLCATHLTAPNIVGTATGFACVPAAINHEFSWDMELPPAPPWRSAADNPAVIKALSVALDRSHGKADSTRADFTQTTRVTIRPLPNWPVIREHVYSHEMQHVCDFKWAARQLYGPVVQMQDDFAAANVRVNCTDRDVLELVANGGHEINTISKYLAATRTMGDHYHGTNGGAAPVLTFAGVSPNGLESYIDLTQPYATFPVSFYTGRPHQYFKVTTAQGVKNEVAASDPLPRPTPALTQDAVDALMGGGGGEDEDDNLSGSGDEKEEYKW